MAATMAMTMAMRRLHALLDSREDYPLPPREIIEQTGSADDEENARAATLAAHFGFGALAGAIFALFPSAVLATWRIDMVATCSRAMNDASKLVKA